MKAIVPILIASVLTGLAAEPPSSKPASKPTASSIDLPSKFPSPPASSHPRPCRHQTGWPDQCAQCSIRNHPEYKKALAAAPELMKLVEGDLKELTTLRDQIARAKPAQSISRHGRPTKNIQNNRRFDRPSYSEWTKSNTAGWRFYMMLNWRTHCER